MNGKFEVPAGKHYLAATYEHHEKLIRRPTG